MKHPIARLVFATGLALSLATPAFAEATSFHGMPISAWAVEFGLANASLTSFDGATISLRHQRSPHAAWRYGLSVSANTSKEDMTRTTAGSAQYTTDAWKNSYSNVSLSVTRLTFPAPEAIVRPWFGLGLEAGWTRTSNERSSDFQDADGTLQSSQRNHDTGNGPSVAMLGLFGLEWSPSDRFAIHAQYGQAIRYRHAQHDYRSRQDYPGSTVENHQEGPVDEWSTYGVSARAGVSVFW